MSIPPETVEDVNTLLREWEKIDLDNAIKGTGVAPKQRLCNAILPDAAADLASDSEYRLREIIHEAIKFMRHNKRNILTSDDVSAALRLWNNEVLHNQSFSEPLAFIHEAGLKRVAQPTKTNELSLDDILSGELPPPPKEVKLKAHWLAVAGVEPLTTPNLEHPDQVPFKRRKLDPVERISAPVGIKHVISKELEVFYKKVTDTALAMGKLGKLSEVPQGTEKEIRGFFEIVLTNLKTDKGIHQLVPYFITFISTTATQNLNQLLLLDSLIQMAECIFLNPHLYIEPYLHQLMPVLLTCVLAEQLCKKPDEDHWALREKTAKLISSVCKKYGNDYPEMQSMITKTFIETFLNPEHECTSHYGAIRGLVEFGVHCIQAVLIPHISTYITMIDQKARFEEPYEEQQEQEGEEKMKIDGEKAKVVVLKEAKADERHKCRMALLDIAANYLNSTARYYSELTTFLSSDSELEQRVNFLIESVPQDFKNELIEATKRFQEWNFTFGRETLEYVIGDSVGFYRNLIEENQEIFFGREGELHPSEGEEEGLIPELNL